MATATTYTKAGTKSTKKTTLPKELFAVDPGNHALIRQAYLAYEAGLRQGAANTKTRGLVRGGGRKPWRQKGTGRARVGSIRSPIWRGGGITFGPTGEENYTKKLNASAKRRAMVQALSLQAASDKVQVIEALQPESGKTKELAQLLSKLGIDRGVTIVVDSKTPELVRAAANLPGVEIKSANYLNVKAVVDADLLLITKPALDLLNTRLGGKR